MNRVKQLVHAENVYRMGYTGKNIRVVTLDTGVYLHPDLRQNPDSQFFMMCKHPLQATNHPLRLSSSILPEDFQRNQLCLRCHSLHSAIRTQNSANMCSVSIIIITGSFHCHKIQKSNHILPQIRILNFSVGFLPGALDREQKQIMELLEQLWDDGVTVVTAAGNNGPGAGTVTAPGISRKVITVGASDDRSSPGERRGGYSGSGPTGCCIMKPEILAPGTNIVSLDHHGALYSRKSGTSMATPVVCGALALALQKNPKLRPEELKLKLYESARKETGMSMAWGVLDVDNLLALV